MKALKILSPIIVLVSQACSDPMETQPVFLPDNQNIHYTGRIDFTDRLKPKLISAGAYLFFTMRGSSCTLIIENEFNEPGHNYISIAIDGHYKKRIRISKGTNKYVIAEGMTYSVHQILVCKATESFNGYLEVHGIQCRSLLKTKLIPERRIEFIGNSITSGAEMDTSEFMCDEGEWHDRHNAYLAYGPSVARSLRAQWVLSSISGMGLIRNWNNEGPGVPGYYDNLYLNGDSSKSWSTEYAPDLVIICLGTNDNSAGDGSYNRKPIDPEAFINGYVQFVGRIRNRYPEAAICLLNSSEFSGEVRERFKSYLESTIRKIRESTSDQNIYSYTWAGVYGKGCTGHPDVSEHKKMAEELIPYLRNIMDW